MNKFSFNRYLESLKQIIETLNPHTHVVDLEKIRTMDQALDELKTQTNEAAGTIENAPNCDSCDKRVHAY